MSSLNSNAELLKYCPQCAKTLDPPTAKKIHCSWCGFELYLNTAAACAALIWAVWKPCRVPILTRGNRGKPIEEISNVPEM